MASFRPTLRDRVVLHISRYTGLAEAVDVPEGITQRGMATALGSSRAQVAQVLGDLRRADLVEDRLCHVRGSPRRLKAYFLTHEGRTLADKMRASFHKKTVRFRGGEGEVEELATREVLRQYAGLDLSGLLTVLDVDGNCCHDDIVALQEGRWTTAGKVEGVKVEKEEAKEEGEVKVEKEEVEAAVPPPPVPVPPPEQVRFGPRPSRLPFAGGLALLVAGIMLPLFLGWVDSSFCAIGVLFIFLGIASVLSYYVSLRMARIEVLDSVDRMIIITFALFMAFLLAFVASIALGTEWDMAGLQIFLFILVPLIIVLVARPVIPAKARGHIGVVVGTFLIALSIATFIHEAAFDWLSLHPVIWITVGAMAAMVGAEVGRPDARVGGLDVASGIGIFMVVASAAGIRYVHATPSADLLIDTPKEMLLSFLAMWALLGVIVALVRFSSEEKLKVYYTGLGATSVVCLGWAFFLFGVWFLKVNRFEGAVDILIGIPVMFYGGARLAGKEAWAKRMLGAMLLYGVILETISLGILLDLF